MRACVLGQLDVDTDSSALPRKFCSSAAEVGRRCSGCASGMLASVDRWLYGPASHSSARALIAQALRDAVPERAPQLAADVGRWCSGCASGAVDRRMGPGGGAVAPTHGRGNAASFGQCPLPAEVGRGLRFVGRAGRQAQRCRLAGWRGLGVPHKRERKFPPPFGAHRRDFRDTPTASTWLNSYGGSVCGE